MEDVTALWLFLRKVDFSERCSIDWTSKRKQTSFGDWIAHTRKGLCI